MLRTLSCPLSRHKRPFFSSPATIILCSCLVSATSIQDLSSYDTFFSSLPMLTLPPSVHGLWKYFGLSSLSTQIYNVAILPDHGLVGSCYTRSQQFLPTLHPHTVLSIHPFNLLISASPNIHRDSIRPPVSLYPNCVIIHRQAIYDHFSCFSSLSFATHKNLLIPLSDHIAPARRQRNSVSRNHRTQRRVWPCNGRNAGSNGVCVIPDLFPHIREPELVIAAGLHKLEECQAAF
jgi:hypothetical protein